MQAIAETLFDLVYLITVITLGIRMVLKSRQNKQYRLFGIMAIVLGCGDSFHLVPRAVALCTTGLENYTSALGIGKLITSITMTIFYLILYYIWRERYQIKGRKNLTISMWGLSILRIALCLLPQNQWLSYRPPLLYGILRNIPFAVMGIIIIIIFSRETKRADDRVFRFMPLAVILSFGFYLPVVLFSGIAPAVGVLMIPKTLAYVWIVLMGWQLYRQSAEKKESLLRRSAL